MEVMRYDIVLALLPWYVQGHSKNLYAEAGVGISPRMMPSQRSLALLPKLEPSRGARIIENTVCKMQTHVKDIVFGYNLYVDIGIGVGIVVARPVTSSL